MGALGGTAFLQRAALARAQRVNVLLVHGALTEAAYGTVSFRFFNARAIVAVQNSLESLASDVLEFQNARVTVLRVRIQPHEKIPIHDVTPRVIVYLTDSHVKLIFPNGSVRNENAKAGQAEWFPAQRHGGENLSDRAVDTSPSFQGAMDHGSGSSINRAPEATLSSQERRKLRHCRRPYRGR